MQIFLDMCGQINGNGKETLRNNLYRNDSSDTKDEGVNGIKVMLKEYKSKDSEGKVIGEEVATTTTSELGKYNEIDGGEYIFIDVEIAKLSNYYIEYEYNGIKYKSVVANISVNNGSKATDIIESNLLDRKFAKIDSTGNNEISVKDSNSSEITKLGYSQTQNAKAIPNYEDNNITLIHSNTKETNYNQKFI